MIIKAISHKSGKVHFRSFLEYVLDRQKQADPKNHWDIVENIPCVSSDIDGLTKAFVENAKLKPKRSDSVELLHELISASPNSGATPEIMYDLTNYYLKLRNKKGGLVVASLHSNTPSLHVHIMLSGNIYGEGTSTSISRKEFYQIREDFERYQISKYPHLKDIVYLPEYKREKSPQDSKFKSDAEYNLKKRGHNTDKNFLQELIEDSFEKAKDRTHFYLLLQEVNGVKVYEYRGKQTGIIFNSRKYRFRRLIDEQTLNHKLSILDRLEELSQIQSNHERESLER